MAGFENPGKSLYTSIRELVENSLDAAESIGVLPEVRRMGGDARPCLVLHGPHDTTGVKSR